MHLNHLNYEVNYQLMYYSISLLEYVFASIPLPSLLVLVKCLRCGVGVKYLLCESTDSLWKARSFLIPDLSSSVVWNDGNVAGILALHYINYTCIFRLPYISHALVTMSTPVEYYMAYLIS